MLESYKTPEGYARRCIGQWIFAVREWVITCIQHDILSIKAYGVMNWSPSVEQLC